MSYITRLFNRLPSRSTFRYTLRLSKPFMFIQLSKRCVALSKCQSVLTFRPFVKRFIHSSYHLSRGDCLSRFSLTCLEIAISLKWPIYGLVLSGCLCFPIIEKWRCVVCHLHIRDFLPLFFLAWLPSYLFSLSSFSFFSLMFFYFLSFLPFFMFSFIIYLF